MSHTRVISDRDGKIKVTITGNPDWSGDMRVQWIEGDVEGHEVIKEAVIPGDVLKLVAQFHADDSLKQRLIAAMEEA